MLIEGEYEPSPQAWVRKQVEAYESSGGTKGTTQMGKPVVIVTMLGARSGKVRKTPLMRVEHGGRYAVVASDGGAPEHPLWYANLVANPEVHLQDRTEHFEVTARTLTGAERAEWWGRAVEAWPDYAKYQTRTDREIPVLVLEPREDS